MRRDERRHAADGRLRRRACRAAASCDAIVFAPIGAGFVTPFAVRVARARHAAGAAAEEERDDARRRDRSSRCVRAASSSSHSTRLSW